jgi:hypothetical protein
MMNDLPDFAAEMDQAEKAAEDMARPILSFYRALKDAGMHEVTTNEVVKLYAAFVFRTDVRR